MEPKDYSNRKIGERIAITEKNQTMNILDAVLLCFELCDIPGGKYICRLRVVMSRAENTQGGHFVFQSVFSKEHLYDMKIDVLCSCNINLVILCNLH